MTRPTPCVAFLLAVSLTGAVTGVGCQPKAFRAAPPPPPPPPFIPAGQLQAGMTEPGVDPDASDDPAAAPAGPAVAIDALVGQIAGRAIYASDLLNDEDLNAELAAVARNSDERAFTQRATQVIGGRLFEMVNRGLVYAEAEANLHERERDNIDAILARFRQQLLRQYGQGSLALAESTILNQTGKSLADSLEEFREFWVVRTYIDRSIDPLIHITRRDIERYYQQHPDEFSGNERWLLRRIRVTDPDAAEAVRLRLEAGEPFLDVASSPVNEGDAGLFSDDPIEADAFAFQPLNDAYAALNTGDWAGPVFQENLGDAGVYWFVHAEEKFGGDAQSFSDAQRNIQQRLQADRRAAIEQRFQRRRFERGGFTPIAEMTADTLTVALARFYPPSDDDS